MAADRVFTSQLLKGVLDLAVLAVLRDTDGYGYDVLRRLRAVGLEDVADASVYGVPDPYFGETVAASVRLKPGVRQKTGATEDGVCAEDLIAWCASDLAKFKVPKYVRFVTDFPLTASGKIQKFKLREEHEAQLRT